MGIFDKLFGRGKQEPAISPSAAMPASQGNNVLRPERFSGLALSRLRNAVPEARCALKDAMTLSIQLPDGTDSSFSLDNAYGFYRSGQKTLDHVLGDLVNSISEFSRQANSFDASQVLPVLKNTGYLDAIREQLKEAMRDSLEKDGQTDPLRNIPHIPLCGDLVVMFVLDSEHNMQMLTRDSMAEIGLNDADLLPTAKANFRRFREGRPVQFVEVGAEGQSTSVYGLHLDDNYEASTLLADDFWDSRPIPVNGDYVVFPANRNRVLVTGSEDLDGLYFANQAAIQLSASQPHAISHRGYRRVAGQWQPAPAYLTVAGKDGEPVRVPPM